MKIFLLGTIFGAMLGIVLTCIVSANKEKNDA
jgi:hypothetical protein